MKLRILFFATFACSLAFTASQGQSSPGFTHYCFRYPSPAEAGHGYPTDRGRPAIPGAGGGIEQQQFLERRVHETDLADARGGKTQHGPCGRLLVPGRTTGRQVRLQHTGRPDPGSQEPKPASRLSMVRQLEERSVRLPACLGEEGLPAFPARPDSRESGSCSGTGSRASRSREARSIELLAPSARRRGTPMLAPLRLCWGTCLPQAWRRWISWYADVGRADKKGIVDETGASQFPREDL